jgi:hypothetical protein
MFIYSTQAGLGDVSSDLSSIGDSLTGVDATTGLPYYLEIAGGLVALLLISRLVGGAKKSYRRTRRKSAQTAARRAALKAQLAAL